MTKKMFFCLALLMSCSSNISSSSVQNNSHFIDSEYGFTYTINDKEIEITRIIESKIESLKKLVIPSSIGDKAITSIAAYAFSNAKIEEIVFEGTSKIKTIDKYAFSDCTELKYLDLPRSLRGIGEGAFYNCISLESVTFADNSNLEIISSTAFYGNESLGYIDIPEKVRLIGDETFCNCTSLVSFKVLSPIETIGYMAFSNAINVEIEFFELSSIPDSFVKDWNLSEKITNNGTYYVTYSLCKSEVDL